MSETGTVHYQTYAQRVTHMSQMGMIRGDDPRATLDPTEVARLRLRSLDGLENAAISVYNRERSEDRMPTEAANDKAALIRSALLAAAAQTPQEADTAPEMGASGVLARNLEKAGLAIHQEYPNDPGVKRILTLAAAAHNSGAEQAARAGFENGSIIQAAAKQNRDPMAVLADLSNHGVIAQDDIRKTIHNADIPTNIDAALEETRPQRPQAPAAQESPSEKPIGTHTPSLMNVQARRAEGRALAIAAQEGGSTFEQETRKEQARKMLCAAVAVERERQSVMKTKEQTQTPLRKTRGNEGR